jgi:predicted methyltransferase
MRKSIASYVKILADALQDVEVEKGLGYTDIVALNKKAPNLVEVVRNNILQNESKPFAGMSDDDKRLLLAFVVYKRQNITTSNTDNPNDEDAARILHKKVFKEKPGKSSKKTIKNLDKELAEQLTKAGLPVKIT